MSGLVRWAANNTLLAMLLTGMLIAAGVYSIKNLPIDAVPDVTNIQVQVVTRAPALSASEMETQITQPVERAMAGTPGLKLTRSVTKLGISIVSLIFSDDVDVYFARAQVNERLSGLRGTIPPEVGVPELGPISTALGEIYMFELKPTTETSRSDEELRTIVEWQIGPKLRQVPGVIEVVGFGGAEKQYRVTVDPSRLAAHGISVEEIRDALTKDNRVAGGGYVERAGEAVVLRGDARFRGLEDIAATVVRTDERGVPIRVAQLGEVDTGPGLRQGAMTRDGRGEIVGASVLMLKGANSREVVTNVRAALEELKPYLPAGVTVDPYYDRAEFINRVLETIAKNLSEGALIVVGCLLLTLGSIRAGLLVAGAIPFAMLIGFIGLYMLGYSGNVMSLGAIDFGIVVEGAVLVVEHAMSHTSNVASRTRQRMALIEAMSEVARPAVFGVIITVLVFLPLATLEDVEGKMFRPVVYSLCFMLVGALFYALVVIPALAPWALRTKPKPGQQAVEPEHGGHAAHDDSNDPWFARAIRRGYRPLIDKVLDFPRATIGGAFALTFVLIWIGSGIGANFMPQIFEGAYAIDTLRPPSASLTQAIALSHEAELALRESPEVVTVVSRIGRPEGAVDPAGPESSDVFVILKQKKDWRKGLTQDDLLRELSDRVDARVPATINAFSQPIEMRVNDLIAGVKSDIAIKVYGDDLGTMGDVADRIRKTVAGIPGAADAKMEIPTGLPSVRIKVNRDRVGRLGVSPGQVLDVLTMARAGLPVGVVREGERVFDLVLRLGGDAINNERDIARLPITTNQKSLVPLAMVADVTEERTIVQIGREQMRRRITVMVNVRGRDMVGFVGDAQAQVAKLDIPKSVELVWGGQFQNFNRAKDRLLMLVPVSLLVIALMLVITYGSVYYTLATVAQLPFALAGGLIALILRGLPFSIPAGVGFIAVSGVSVITGIVMTSNVIARPRDEDPRERVKTAVVAGLRALVSTALIAAIGFIPAAIATGTGVEVQRPLATVVIGGLMVSMGLSLFVLPAMLYFIAKREHETPPAPVSMAPGELEARFPDVVGAED